MAGTTIPVVDIAAFLDGSDPARVAAEVDAACRSLGFLVVTGHGVDPALVARARAEATAFFDRPEHEKLAVATSAYTGYSPFRGERLAYSLGAETPPDLKEAFTVAQVDRGEGEYWTGEDGQQYFPVNVFPDDQPGLELASTELYRALGALGERVMAIFAVALGLPADHFTALVDRHFSYLRYVHYPAPVEPPLDGQLRAGAHTDYGTLTFVHTEDAPGGLQVRGDDGSWIDVPVVPGGFVVNLGDLMSEWTNDQWRSTLHRVVVPEPEDYAASRRLSIVYFHEPNHDTVVEVLPTCVPEGERPRHEPVTAGAHLAAKVARQVTLT